MNLLIGEVTGQDADRTVDVLDVDRLAGDFGDDLHQFIHRDIFFAANVDRLVAIGLHQAEDSIHEVVHECVGTHRGAVTPDLDGTPVLDAGNLAAHGGRGFFAAPRPGSARAVAVLKTCNPCDHVAVARVSHGHPLGIEFFPPVLVVRHGGIGLLLGQIGFFLAHVPVDAGGRGKEIAGDAGRGGRVDHVDIAQSAVAHDLAFGRMNEPHAPHVGGKLVDLVDRFPVNHNRLVAVGRLAQIEQRELVPRGRPEFLLFDINATDPVTFSFEFLDQMPANKTTRTAHHSCLHDIASFFTWGRPSKGRRPVTNLCHPQ